METQDLVYLLACAVNGTCPDAGRVAAMDLDALYALSERHLLTAAAAPALEAAGVKDARFSGALAHSAMKNAQMDLEMDAVLAGLTEAGIWHMPLKGAVLQQLYPIYGMRQMSDRDILFDATRADDVKAIMEGLDFQTEEFGYLNHDVYYKQPVSNFEMHRALIDPGDDERMHAYYRDVEGRLLGEGLEKRFSPEDFYLFLVAHEYKHYAIGGTGLRSLLDVYVFLRREPLDMDYVAAEASTLGLAEFEAMNRSLALRLFSGAALSEAEREMLDHILSSGAYGTEINRVENRARKRLAHYGHGKLRYMLERFFEPLNKNSPNRHDLVREFPFFYRHRILLPLLLVWRVLLRLKSGRLRAELKSIKNAVHEENADASTNQDRDRLPPGMPGAG